MSDEIKENPAKKYKRLTYDDYINLEGHPEIIDGIPYSMTPAPSVKHQRISKNLYDCIRDFLSGKSCEIFYAPLDVRILEKKFGVKNTIVQPDLAVICNEKIIDDAGVFDAPDIIVEIISPTTAYKDTKIKFKLYEKAGVLEYWIVRPDEQSITVMYLNNNGKYKTFDLYAKNDILKCKLLDGLTINLKSIFSV